MVLYGDDYTSPSGHSSTHCRMKLLSILILGIPICFFFGILATPREVLQEDLGARYYVALGMLYLFWLAGTLYYFS